MMMILSRRLHNSQRDQKLVEMAAGRVACASSMASTVSVAATVAVHTRSNLRCKSHDEGRFQHGRQENVLSSHHRFSKGEIVRNRFASKRARQISTLTGMSAQVP